MSDALDRAMELIVEFGLHESGAPVDLTPLDAIATVTIEDLRSAGCSGLCVANEPATETRPAKIALCRTLTPHQRRLTHAHELGHALIGYSGVTVLSGADPWFTMRQEREAWQVAAVLLIPPFDQLDMAELTIDGLANACGVPSWLVGMYP